MTSDLAARPVRRLQAEQRRQEILEAAASVALEEGLEAVTKRRVAERMGCAPGLVHHYFATVELLAAEAFTSVMEAELERTFSRFDAAATASAGFRSLFAYWFDPTETDYGRLWLDAWSYARRRPAIKGAVEEAMRSGQRRLVGAIDRGLAEGEISSGDPDADAWTILTLLDGLIVQSALNVSFSAADVRSTLFGFAESLLRVRLASDSE